MGGICCKKVTFTFPFETSVGKGSDVSGSGKDTTLKANSFQIQHQRSPVRLDDVECCAIDELIEGCMDLKVVFPDGHFIKLKVARRTSMMDVLVQATSAHKMSPGGHIILASPNDSETATYKPSTPIGSLDTNTVFVIPKRDLSDHSRRKMAPKVANQPFEPTFRLAVHLPRKQLVVMRVGPSTTISQLLQMVCTERGLDVQKHKLVRPNNLSSPLEGSLTLAQYGSTEIRLLTDRCIETHLLQSQSNIFGDVNLKCNKPKISKTKSLESSKLSQESCNGTMDEEELVSSKKKKRPAPCPPLATTTVSQSRDSRTAERPLLESSSSSSSGVSSLLSTDSSDCPIPVMSTKVRKRPAPLPPTTVHQVRNNNGGEQIPTEVLVPVCETPETPTRCETSSSGGSGVERSENSEWPVTMFDVAKLSAHINQNVRRQEIASRLESAFGSFDLSTSETTTPTSIDRCKPIGHSSLTATSSATKRREAPAPVHVTCESSKVEETLVDTQSPTPSRNINFDENQTSTSFEYESDNDDPDTELLTLELQAPPQFCNSSDQDLTRDSPVVQVLSVSYSRTERDKYDEQRLLDVDVLSEEYAKPPILEHSQNDLDTLVVQNFEEFVRNTPTPLQYSLGDHIVLPEFVKMPANSSAISSRTLRQTHSLPNGSPEDLGSLDEESVSTPDSGRSTLLTRSLSCEPTEIVRKGNHRRSIIDIPLLYIDPLMDIAATTKCGSSPSSTLRSSTNKTTFKPPQVKTSTKCRQRIPPEILKENDASLLKQLTSTGLTTLETAIVKSEPVHESRDLIDGNKMDDVTKSKDPPLKKCASNAKHDPEDIAKSIAVHVTGSTSMNNRNLTEIPRPPPLPKEAPPARRKKILETNSKHSETVSQLQNIGMDPRQQLLQDIRKFGKTKALKKVDSEKDGW